MKKNIFILAGLILLIACSSKEAKNTKVSQIAKNYKKLNKMTKSPVFVNPQIAVLCTAPSKATIDNIKKEKGPHAMASVLMYMNDSAAKAFKTKPFKFPEGAVIVKDKLTLSRGVGGMIKRHKGYDPKNGDWEYFYFNKPDKIQSGKIESCIKCHSAKSKTDYVFGDWATRKEF